MADIKTAQQTLVRKIQETAESTSDLEKLAYASSGLEKLASQSFDTYMASDMFSIGKVGEQGFGVAAIADEDLPAGFVKLYGHDDITSPNYGNVLDNNGSTMVWVPKFYFKIDGNVVFISDIQETGYVIHRAFVDNGIKKGFFVDKYGCGNVGGKFISKQGIDPCSTNSAHNPISALNNIPANNYGGLYTAVKTRGSIFGLTSVFIYKALALLAYAQGQAATSSANCAFIDVNPKMPKGNLVSALHDVNDTSVVFTASGYSDCALTGSGNPFAKTTHNGQSCGVADLNGNMWEVASGFILLETVAASPAPTDFRVLKETVSIADLATDTEAYTSANYDTIDLTDLIPVNETGTSVYFGNGVNQVFAMSTDTNSDLYKRTAIGIPIADGVSAAGTTQFGNDYLYKYFRNEMACFVGGYWGNSSDAGVFAGTLSNTRTSSAAAVGGRASCFV